jgi:phosphoribosylanthranilate isomerase
LLAGGLNPDNVARAIRTSHPFGVDTASGVETSPGIKDFRKMSAFVKNARAAFAHLQGNS